AAVLPPGALRGVGPDRPTAGGHAVRGRRPVRCERRRRGTSATDRAGAFARFRRDLRTVGTVRAGAIVGGHLPIRGDPSPRALGRLVGSGVAAGTARAVPR